MIGRTLSHFRIVARIGEGGMGVVYKAEDEKLHRSVALKVLPPEAVGDEERRLRFLHEARAAASLNHPNIATIHEVDEADGVVFIAMEHIKGKTLRSLMAGKSLPVREALRVGIEIADGLACAHRSRIIHRDLKPENVMVTADGHVKILDFGLAKLLEKGDDLRTGERSRLDTISGEMTGQGRILGTAAYMSPEQARGQSVDCRSDLFAFGIVLYEMATGRVPFHGSTPMDTLSAILNQPFVPAAELNHEIPPELERILGKCLEKDPSERYQDTRDLVVDLKRFKRDTESKPLTRPVTEPVATPPASQQRAQRQVLLATGLGVLLLAGLIWLGWRLWPHASMTTQPTRDLKQRLILSNPESGIYYASISPDGNYVAMVDATGISLRLLDTGEIRHIPSPEGQTPITVDWAADGTRLLVGGIDSGRKRSVWAIPILTGSARRLFGENSWGPKASPDGSLISFIKQSDSEEIWVMGPQGESPRRFARLEPGSGISGCSWSPDGRRIAYARQLPSQEQVVLESRDLKGGAAAVILSDPRLLQIFGSLGGIYWLPDGRLIFALREPPPNAADSNLWAVRADPRTGAALGRPFRLTSWAGSQVSPYRATADGRYLLFARRQSQGDVYVGELQAGGTRLGTPRRLTLDNHNDWVTGWTGDSRRVLFSSDRNGSPDIFAQDLAGNEATPLVVSPDVELFPLLAPGGSSILYWSSPAAEGLSPSERTLMRADLLGGSPRIVLKAGSMDFYNVKCPIVASAPCILGALDDKELVFYALDLEKGRKHPVARSRPPGGTSLMFDLAADGSRIALMDKPGETDRIRILSLPGGETHDIVLKGWKRLQWVAWARDGKFLFVSAQREQKRNPAILHVDLHGRVRVLLESSRPGEWLGRPRPSPDGRYLAYGSRNLVTEVWTLENF